MSKANGAKKPISNKYRRLTENGNLSRVVKQGMESRPQTRAHQWGTRQLEGGHVLHRMAGRSVINSTPAEQRLVRHWMLGISECGILSGAVEENWKRIQRVEAEKRQIQRLSTPRLPTTSET